MVVSAVRALGGEASDSFTLVQKIADLGEPLYGKLEPTGYPETVLLRLIDPNGRPSVKIESNERGGGVGLGGRADPTYAMLSARGETAALKLTNQDGRSQEWKP